MQLVGFIIRIYHDARLSERQVLRSVHIPCVTSAWYNELFVSSLLLLWRNFTDARVGFLKAVLINVQVFWDMAPCGLVRNH